MEQLAPGMSKCYIWMDFGCLDQDNLPPGEVKQFIEVIKCADCLFTPVYGTVEVKTNKVSNWYTEYCADAWNAENTGYVDRAWCRAEMLFGASVPIYTCPSARMDKFAGTLKLFISHGTRPHMLYGNREDRVLGLPTVLSPMEAAMFPKLNPTNGQVTNPNDRDKLAELVQALKPYVASAKQIAPVPALRNDLRQGRDTVKYPNGDIYTGDFVNGLKACAKGHMEYENGDIYDGEFVNGAF